MEKRSEHPNRLLEWVVWGILALMVVAVVVVYFKDRQRKSKDAGLSVSGSGNVIRPLHQLADFSLTDQSGQKIGLADLRGKVWIADIIFTRCPGPCAAMTLKMAEIQAALPKDAPVRFVSLTSDPVHDTPKILEKYGKKYGADPSRWSFLTGPKADIVRLAVDEMKLTVIDKEERERTHVDDLFIHTTGFVLVDKEGRTRGALFDVLEEGGKEHLLDAVKKLLQE